MTGMVHVPGVLSVCLVDTVLCAIHMTGMRVGIRVLHVHGMFVRLRTHRLVMFHFFVIAMLVIL
jgi:hypothetical protein